MTEEEIYRYQPHAWTSSKVDHLGTDSVRVADQLPHGTAVARCNAWIAVRVTRGVGTMWCAYAFAALALVSLPAAVRSHSAVEIVSWVSQTFLQLVLLSVVIVGQNVLASAADRRSEATSHDADAILHESVKLQEHLLAQDVVLRGVVARLAALGPEVG